MGDGLVSFGEAKTIASLPSHEGVSRDEVIPDVEGYRIEGELGRGGMGVVYKATQIKLGRLVAIKMVLGSDAQGEAQERFIHEAEAVARFQHPNIVQIYEIGEVDGRPFFTLEYVEGGTLEAKLDRKPLSWRPATELLNVLARAIHAAHLRGIVHRDLKPANILLSKDGIPKITDFGIAKRLDAADQTQVGKILGTPAYMAPEQAMGRVDRVGAGTDIYALGAILYDVLTGRPPFEAENTMDTLIQAIAREPVPPRTLQPNIPRDLNIICLKCLEKAPEKRYLSALELAADLERVLAGEPILARPISNRERAQRWVRRHPAWGTLIIVSIFGLVSLFIAGAWFTQRLRQELRATEAARKEATDAQEEIRLRLVRSTAQRITSDLRLLAEVPQVMALALSNQKNWTEEALSKWLVSAIGAEAHIFGMAVAFEPEQFKEGTNDFCLYAFRGEKGIETKQLLPPDYSPIYREWGWYRDVPATGSWSDPYVDEGGGNIPMVTFSMPFDRDGKKAGVVTVDLSLHYFGALNDDMKSSSFGGKSSALVVTHQGVILSHPDERLQFPRPEAQLPLRSDSAVWSRVLGKTVGRTRGVDIATGRSAELLFAPVTAAGWTCIVVMPE